MAETWQTIEQAAVVLGLSVRTVNRHISAGKLPSRLTDGRREVLVNLPDAPPDPGGVSPDDAPQSNAQRPWTDNPSANGQTRPTTGTTPPNPGATFDPETVLALADNAAEKAEMAVAAYQALARVADNQAQTVRRNARIAWATVGVMAAGVTIAVGWTSHQLTRSSGEIDRVQTEVGKLTTQVAEITTEREALRTQLSTTERELRAETAAARELAAETKGRLSAVQDALTSAETERQARELQAAGAAPSYLSFEPPLTLVMPPMTGSNAARGTDAPTADAPTADAPREADVSIPSDAARAESADARAPGSPASRQADPERAADPGQTPDGGATRDDSGRAEQASGLRRGRGRARPEEGLRRTTDAKADTSSAAEQ